MWKEMVECFKQFSKEMQAVIYILWSIDDQFFAVNYELIQTNIRDSTCNLQNCLVELVCDEIMSGQEWTVKTITLFKALIEKDYFLIRKSGKCNIYNLFPGYLVCSLHSQNSIQLPTEHIHKIYSQLHTLHIQELQLHIQQN